MGKTLLIISFMLSGCATVPDYCGAVKATLTVEQRKKIREVCKRHGADYAKITNTPERSIMDAEVYKEAYAQALDAEQKKRVEPQ